MSNALENLAGLVLARCGEGLERVASRCGELTFEVPAERLVDVCRLLRDDPGLKFEQLVDLTGVDYLDYGRVEWNTETATNSGFSRGRALTRPVGNLSQKREREAKRERVGQRYAGSRSCVCHGNNSGGIVPRSYLSIRRQL